MTSFNYKRSLFIVSICLFVFCIFASYYWQSMRRNKFSVWKEVIHKKIPISYKGKQLRFHEVFEPRKVSFSDYNFTVGSENTSGKMKIILLDTQTPWRKIEKTINYYVLEPGSVTFEHYGCPNTNCTVISDKNRLREADAVLYHLTNLPETFPKTRPSNQVWIAYVMEAPWLVETKWAKLRGVFNWTMSYREDSDVKVKYGFVGKKPESGLKNPSSNEGTPFHEKKSVVWFVSDCQTPSKREEYVRELQKHIDVDVYGACGSKHCFPSQSSLCYDDVLKKYKLYLSFENSLCADYVTEKFFNALEYDVVPIVYGGADYERHGPPGGFVDATRFANPENLAAHLKAIAANEIEHNKYLEWKSSYGSYLYPWMCYLCDKLHAPIVPTVVADLRKWWVDDAHCRTWAKDKGFKNV